MSKKATSDDAFCWASDGKSGFSITPTSKAETGSDITLFLKSDAKEYLDEALISNLIKKYSDHISFPINLLSNDADQIGRAHV